MLLRKEVGDATVTHKEAVSSGQNDTCRATAGKPAIQKRLGLTAHNGFNHLKLHRAQRPTKNQSRNTEQFLSEFTVVHTQLSCSSIARAHI